MRATLKIRKIGNEILWREAAEVKEAEFSKMRRLSAQIRALGSMRACYGIAAPQVGISKRAFSSTIGEYKFYINPKIIDSHGTVVKEEGCLSIPGLWIPIERPAVVFLQASDLSGNMVHVEASGLEARLFLHELDHLNGATMFDHLKPEQISEYEDHPLFALKPPSYNG